MEKIERECTCGNPEYGFDCVCDFVEAYPGDNEYTCQYCGIYKASRPKCNKCEQNNIDHSSSPHV